MNPKNLEDTHRLDHCSFVTTEKIGIERGANTVALRPFQDFEDASEEYGLSPREVENSYDRVSAEVKEELKAGQLLTIRSRLNL